jgi:hypothetical protein
MSYEIRRFFLNEAPGGGLYEVVGHVETREEAKEHCSDPQTSSRTATDPDLVKLTEQFGAWFDGFQEV